MIQASTIGGGIFQLRSPTTQHRSEHQRTGQIGTPNPLGPSFSLPFLGKSLEDVAKQIKGKRPNVRFLRLPGQGSGKVVQSFFLPA